MLAPGLKPLLVLFILYPFSGLRAQSNIGIGEEPMENENANIPEDNGYAERMVYSSAAKKKECQLRNGKYLGYYDHIYYVENCTLRLVTSSKILNHVTSRGVKLQTVGHETIAMLKMGQPLTELTSNQKNQRTCKQLESKYITHSYTDIFFVSKCRKKAFPDWTTFIAHRKSTKKRKSEVLALTWGEFSRIKLGTPFESTIDSEFEKLLTGEAGIEVIPIDEACAGVNHKNVSYVDKIYRIENCSKREYDAAAFVRKRAGKPFKLKELTAEQWLSMPEGPPMNLRPPSE